MMERCPASDDAGAPDGSILIVEDDPGAAEAFEQMLKIEGYDVRVAPDAKSTLAEVERALPVAIVLDLRLPGTSGLEVLRQIQAATQPVRIPVAVVTGDYLVGEEVARELQVLGVPLHFKPLWEEDLVRLVRDLLTPRDERR